MASVMPKSVANWKSWLRGTSAVGDGEDHDRTCWSNAYSKKLSVPGAHRQKGWPSRFWGPSLFKGRWSPWQELPNWQRTFPSVYFLALRRILQLGSTATAARCAARFHVLGVRRNNERICQNEHVCCADMWKRTKNVCVLRVHSVWKNIVLVLQTFWYHDLRSLRVTWGLQKGHFEEAGWCGLLSRLIESYL